MQPPGPSTQLQLSLEHPRAMFPRQLKANGRQWSHHGEDTRTRSPTTSVSQVYLNNKPNITTLPTVSPTTPSLCPILLQQLTPSSWSIMSQHLLRPYDLYYNSTHYVSLLHLLQQLLRLHDLSCYRNKDTLRSTPLQQLLHLYVLISYDLYYSSNHLILTYYLITATLMILWPILFQPLNRPQDL